MTARILSGIILALYLASVVGVSLPMHDWLSWLGCAVVMALPWGAAWYGAMVWASRSRRVPAAEASTVEADEQVIQYEPAPTLGRQEE